jgi:hypothetical protein
MDDLTAVPTKRCNFCKVLLFAENPDIMMHHIGTTCEYWLEVQRGERRFMPSWACDLCGDVMPIGHTSDMKERAIARHLRTCVVARNMEEAVHSSHLEGLRQRAVKWRMVRRVAIGFLIGALAAWAVSVLKGG